jgi:acetyltransferase-like isoleucine patch superfamily enzyme
MARTTWAMVTLVIVEGLVCGVALLPVGGLWYFLLNIVGTNVLARLIIVSLAIVPSYVLFALALMIVSPLVMRMLGWHTPADKDMPLADLDWSLLSWVRYGAAIHLVRVVAGTVFRATPLWTFHLRLSGARLGKRVYVNSLGVSDYNLLECGDDVVIGASVHVSGHTVESGVVKTARVKLGDRVTIGIGSVIEIGVEIGPGAQIGAMSFVPKHTKLPGGVTYVGVPAEPIK